MAFTCMVMTSYDFSAVCHGSLWLHCGVSEKNFRERPTQYADFPLLGKVCRLGLATRGNTALEPEDVLKAIDCGVNYLNWCTHPDGLSNAVRQLGSRRKDIFIAAQIYAHTAEEAKREINGYLTEMQTDYLDALTFYYLEKKSEWEIIISNNGAMKILDKMKSDGTLRAIGVTSHQRDLSSELANSRKVDCLMIRYNAAHRGAEADIFPTTKALHMPVISYTGTRWGALLEGTPEDPKDFVPPSAPDWYRFTLCHPEVTVSLMAPNGRKELNENLKLLENWRGINSSEYAMLKEHGDRVHKHATAFP